MIGLFLTLIYISLLFFGLVYAMLVYQLGKRNQTEGRNAILVVFGTLVTLLGAWAIERTTGCLHAWQVFLCFACDGAPMAAADILTYLIRRKNGKHLIPENPGEAVPHDNRS